MKFKRIAATLLAVLLMLTTLTVAVSAKEATGIKTNVTALTIGEGESVTLKATLTPAKSTTKKQTWKSSASRIATVDSKGKVVGKKAGKATISVTTTGGKVAKVPVTVKAKPTKLTLAKTKTLTLDQTSKAVAVTATPKGAQVSGTWSSSAPKVAKVDAKTGKITPLTVGTTNIKFTSYNKVVSSAMKLTVTKPAPTKITLSQTSATLGVGESIKPTLKFTSAKADTTVTWTSSVKNVVSISGGTIKAVGKGVTTITIASKKNSKIKATIKVTVKNKPTAVAFKTVTTAAKPYVMGMGQTPITPSVTITPTDALATRTYASGNTKIITVDKTTGKITPVGTGITYVRVTTWNKLSKDLYVQIKPAPTQVKLSATTTMVAIGKTLPLTTTITPADAHSARAYESNNEKVATVSQSGIVTGIGVGTADIKVTAYNNKSWTLKITVTTPEILDSITKINAATALAQNNKAGFKWKNSGTQTSSGSIAVSLVPAQNIPEETTALPVEESTIAKNATQGLLLATKLVPGDVTSAKITYSGKNTVYTLTIANETNPNQNSAINHFGVYKDAKGKMLYMTSTDLDTTFDSLMGQMMINPTTSISLKTQNVKIVATIDPNGRLVNLTYEKGIVLDISASGSVKDPDTGKAASVPLLGAIKMTMKLKQTQKVKDEYTSFVW
ncbi:MAG: Ig-like domain-containing protein [Oscillospiraceae bacterium]|jgi:uncharacterized protein YjdB|nr:Ig-like domain-containing protein [Oscillospiraceae bacterium]